MTIDELFTLENLNNAFHECSRIAHWKESSQRYRANLLMNNFAGSAVVQKNGVVKSEIPKVGRFVNRTATEATICETLYGNASRVEAVQ